MTSGEHASGGGETQLDGVGRVEEVLLVLLEVLVVRERKPVEDAVERPQVGGHPWRLGAEELAASGFFFWGMMLEPLVNASGTSQNPN